MAKVNGKSGRILSGANVIAEVTEFELTRSTAFAEGAAVTDTYMQHAPGTIKISGSLKAWYDPSDTNGQMALDPAASVTLNLRPEGSTTGDVEFQIAGFIGDVTITTQNDQYVEFTATFVGNSLTETTV